MLFAALTAKCSDAMPPKDFSRIFLPSSPKKKTPLVGAAFTFAAQAPGLRTKTGEYQSPILVGPIQPQPYYSTPSCEPPTYRGYTYPNTRLLFDQERYNRDYGVRTQRNYLECPGQRADDGLAFGDGEDDRG